MLKQRIITALLLVSLLLAALFAADPIYWRVFISVVVLIGFWEWLRFCQLRSTGLQVIAYGGFGLTMWVLQSGMLDITLVISVLCLLWVLLIVFTLTEQLDVFHQTALKVVIGIVLLAAGAWLIISFKSLEYGPAWVLCFGAAVWVADVGAYFVGKRFGETKLAPKVSPGKTVEGFLGGLALTVLVFVPVLFSLFSLSEAALLLISVLLTAIVSVGGDLFESKLKRHADIKDSSQILPGHGGVLDRIDSLLSGAPFFALGLLLLGYLS